MRTLYSVEPPDHTYALITHSCSLFSSVPPLCFSLYKPLSLVFLSHFVSLSSCCLSTLLSSVVFFFQQPHLTGLPPPSPLGLPLPFALHLHQHLSFTLPLICLTSTVITSFSLYIHRHTHSGNTPPPLLTPVITFTRIDSDTGRYAARPLGLF